MQRARIVPVISSLLVLAIVFASFPSSGEMVPAGADHHTISPVSQKFQQYLAEHRMDGLSLNLATTNPLGYVPPIVDLSHTTGMQIDGAGDFAILKGESYSALKAGYSGTAAATPASRTGSTPSRFDLRTTGKVSSVKEQGSCGSCWAFSSLASMESILLPGESWDFSENNMRNNHGFDLMSCQGGNSVMAAAYLTRWSGAVTEASDPYSQVSKTATSITMPNTAAVKHVQDIYFLPARSSGTDNANIKAMLMQKGAVYSSIRWEDNYYKASTASYYYTGGNLPNHAITIVGWDDNYDRSRFARLPAGNGAFIVKNSWGPEWGENGYFYVSYYDTQIGQDNAVFTADSPRNYYHIYQYDPLGWTVSYGDGSDVVYFSNIFTAQAAENIAAVSFYTPALNSQYKISIYRNAGNTPVSGSTVSTDSGTINIPGYHTIALSQPVAVNSGERFSVVVKLTAPGYQYPVALEYPYAGYSSRATARTGESFVSNNGVSWTDVTTIYPNSNVCLKAFTVKSTGAAPTTQPTTQPTVKPTTVATDTTPPSVSISSPVSYAVVAPGASIPITWSATDNKGVAGVDIDYSSDSGVSWKSISSNQAKSGTVPWTVPSTSASTISIRVKARDTSGNTGTQTKVCFVRSTSSGKVLKESGKVTDSGILPAVPSGLTRPNQENLTSSFMKTDFSGFFF